MRILRLLLPASQHKRSTCGLQMQHSSMNRAAGAKTVLNYLKKTFIKKKKEKTFI